MHRAIKITIVTAGNAGVSCSIYAADTTGGVFSSVSSPSPQRHSTGCMYETGLEINHTGRKYSSNRLVEPGRWLVLVIGLVDPKF